MYTQPRSESVPVAAMSAPARHDGNVGVAVAEEPVSVLIEQAGRAAGLLAFREAQLAAVRHGPELRRAARDVAIVLGAVLAFLSAFALANWAVVRALSGPLPAWGALLLLAATWIVIGILLLVALRRGDSVFAWWQRMLSADVGERTSGHSQARDVAERGMRESLERLGGGVGNQAALLASAAVVPVAGGVVTAGEHIIDQIDEITDDLGEAVPGGGAINWVADLALVPGRYFLGAARTALDELGDELRLPGQPRRHADRPEAISGPDRRPAA
jgi:hypothetical protein